MCLDDAAGADPVAVLFVVEHALPTPVAARAETTPAAAAVAAAGAVPVAAAGLPLLVGAAAMACAPLPTMAAPLTFALFAGVASMVQLASDAAVAGSRKAVSDLGCESGPGLQETLAALPAAQRLSAVCSGPSESPPAAQEQPRFPLATATEAAPRVEPAAAAHRSAHTVPAAPMYSSSAQTVERLHCMQLALVAEQREIQSGSAAGARARAVAPAASGVGSRDG